MFGYFCCCAAYDGIFRALSGACAGRYDTDSGPGPREEAEEKLRGSARYAVDVRPEGVLEARVLRAPHGSGVLARLDVESVRAAPGVMAVEALLQVGDPIRYVGQEILAVAAVDRASAEAALARAGLELEEHPPVIGLDAARTGPSVWPRRRRGPVPNANEAPALPGIPWEGNVRGPMPVSFGLDEDGADRATLEAPLRVSFSVETAAQSHSPLEPRAVVADWGAERLRVWLSTQAVTATAEDIAERWGLRRDQVQVIAPHVGGGFGSKAVLELTTRLAIDLSRAAGRPVRLVLDRDEELLVGGFRPAQRIQVAAGCAEDGSLAGLTMRAEADSGVAVGAVATLMARICYRHRRKRLEDWDLTTNVAPGKPLRAPGGPPAYFALESLVDMAAAAAGLDPLTQRRRWDSAPRRLGLYDWAEAQPAWSRRGRGDGGRFRRGVGVAAASWYHLVQPSTRVRVEVDRDGFVVRCATQDMGNGARTVLARAVAEVTGAPRRRVRVEIGDSDLPHGPLSGGSRTTTSLWPAATEAAQALMEEIREVAGIGPGPVDWDAVLPTLPRLEATGRRRPDEGGWWLPMSIEELAVGRELGHGLQLTEVEVDTWLGRVTVVGMWGRYSVGRIVAPTLARSQVFGAMVQNLSWTLFEARHLDPATGRLVTSNLEDYRIAGFGDVPLMEASFDEEGPDRVRGGAMGLSELAACPVAASIGNAVAEATGWRPARLPIRVSDVLAGLA